MNPVQSKHFREQIRILERKLGLLKKNNGSCCAHGERSSRRRYQGGIVNDLRGPRHLAPRRTLRWTPRAIVRVLLRIRARPREAHGGGRARARARRNRPLRHVGRRRASPSARGRHVVRRLVDNDLLFTDDRFSHEHIGFMLTLNSFKRLMDLSTCIVNH